MLEAVHLFDNVIHCHYPECESVHGIRKDHFTFIRDAIKIREKHDNCVIAIDTIKTAHSNTFPMHVHPCVTINVLWPPPSNKLSVEHSHYFNALEFTTVTPPIMESR